LKMTYGPHYYDAGEIGEKIIEKNGPVLKDLQLVSPTDMIRTALKEYNRKKRPEQKLALPNAA
ncbi:MAG TPA: hypothetical protein VI874_05110, partial [Candidatus Norongarragalinales archaeon]|nr:hypothetical protein [Candidatus Norongarragalinales archaeon]